MTRSGERDLSRIGAIDYVLMTFGSCLAAFSAGMAIQQPAISLFSIVAIGLGALTSYSLRSIYLTSSYIKLDGYLYSLAIICAFAFGGPLETLMPGGGYAVDVLAAGWLSWMLILGSFFTWQDNTLVFQAIPSVALLGLVGVYDTYRDIRYAFFGYLLCLATLFARAHRRAMLRQAADSGYFTRGLAPGTPTPSVETTPGLAARMQEGPWRWTAGPGWALASALTVVLISLVGTPVVRDSVQSVTGFVKVPTPQSLRPRNQTQTATTAERNGMIRVGQGPNNSLTADPVLEVGIDRARYLRQAWYDIYDRGSWSCSGATPSQPIGPEGQADVIDLNAIDHPQELSFSLRLRRLVTPVPIPVSMIRGWDNGRSPGVQGRDGRWETYNVTIGDLYRGVFLAPATGTPTDAATEVPAYYQGTLNEAGISQRVHDLAQQAAQGATSDYDKAERIRKEIANRIVYNLAAKAPAGGEDPVDFVLFEQKGAYCDIYASAMTLMARSVGIPARFCVGYLPDESERDPNGIYVVKDSDLHAWSELFFKDYGWVVFDATEGSRSVPGAGRGDPNDLGPIWQRTWFKIVLDIAIVALVLGAGYAAVRPLIRKRQTMTARSALGLAYFGFARALEKATKTTRQPSQTPDEFLLLVAPKLGTAREAATQLNNRFVLALYANQPVTKEDVAKLRADVRNLKQMLRKVSQPK